MASARNSSFWLVLILAAIGFLLIAGWLYVKRDLRGWDGADPNDPTAIVATLPGKPNFTLEDCVPGTVYPYDVPTVEEYAGTATATVLICRSRSSALAVIIGYLVLVGAVLLFFRSRSKRA
ncbi:MAG TPA: hypothetical protein VEA80_07035 [Vitreimonas sp.]|uniref:hypothetical protein n=1 Tax=Vitreimonas sp. TaxID=3069702 RepID=UPI002D689E10|nr:hypothetical protein [Vitreimonas sp.]HYD87210.1 hypothetical protein [Vitreimonas sp.]